MMQMNELEENAAVPLGTLVPRAILESRICGEKELLVVCGDPRLPIWVSADEVKSTFPTLLEMYETQTFYFSMDFFKPCSSEYRDNVLLDQYRFPQGDVYVESETTVNIVKKLKIQSFSFEMARTAEEVAARVIFAPPPLARNSEFFMANEREFYEMQLPETLLYSAAWAVSLNPVELFKECYELRLTPVAVYGADYFTIARELERYGLISSQFLTDIADFYFVNYNEEHPRVCKAVISFGIANINTSCERRLLVLEEVSFLKTYATFLGVQTMEDFAFLELANLEKIVSLKPELTPTFPNARLLREQVGDGSQAYICKYNMTFSEAVRTKHFLETDSCVARMLGEHQSTRKDKIALKSQIAWLEMAVWIIGSLLNRLWSYGETVKQLAERSKLLEQFLDSLASGNVNLLTIVVPDCMLEMTLEWLQKRNGVQILTALHDDVFLRFDDRKMKLILLTESQICAYFIVCSKYPGFLPTESLSESIIFPFTSTRNIELLAEEAFFLSGAKTPICYTFVCNNSIEEQILVFRQQLCHITQEEMRCLEHKADKFGGSSLDVYTRIMLLIKENGFDGNWADGRYDWRNHSFSIQSDEDFSWMYKYQWINRYNFNCQILHASIIDLFNISPMFNTSLFSQYLENVKAGEQVDFQHLNKVEMSDEWGDEYQLFYYQFNKNHDRSFRSAFELPNFQQSEKMICETVDKILLFEEQNVSTPSQQLCEYINNGQHFGEIDVCYENVENNVMSYIYMPIYKIPPSNKYESVTSINLQFLDGSVYEEQGGVMSIGNIVEADIPSIDFVQNQQLSIISYSGARRFDEIIIKGRICPVKHQELLMESMKQYNGNEQTQYEAFVAALGLIDNDRCYTIRDVYEGYNFDITNFPPQYVIDCLIEHTLKAGAKNAFLADIDHSQILRHIAPFELFIPMEILSRLNSVSQQHFLFRDSIYDLTEELIMSNIEQLGAMEEYTSFLLEYFNMSKIESLVQAYGVEQRFQMLNSLIKVFQEKRFGNSEFSSKILSTPVFYTKCIATDSMLLEISFSLSPDCPKGLFSETRFKQAYLAQSDTFLYTLHRCFSETVKNISCSSVYEFMPQSDVVAVLKQFQSRNSKGVQKLLNTGYDLPHFYKGVIFPLTNKKLFSGEIVYNLTNIKRRTVQESKSSVPQTEEEKNDVDSSERKETTFSQPDQIPSNKSLYEEQNDTSISKPESVLNSELKLQEPLSTSLTCSFIPSLDANLSFQHSHVDLVIQQVEKEIFLKSMKRIMNHYSCRSYYSHKNLLYVPEVCIIQSVDAIRHQFGLPVTYLTSFETDPTFMSLLELLTNEFKRQNDNKSPNIHKFCTVFNENIKKKLECISRATTQESGAYSSILIVYQWLLKRTLQAECDLNKNSLIVFREDPVLGLGIENCHHQTSKRPEKSRFAYYTDWLFDGPDKEEVLEEYNMYKQYLDQIPPDYRNKQLLMLVKIGIGTGSTPLETFYRFIQKDDPYKVSKTLAYLTNLLVLCQECELDFPYKLANITSNEDEINASVYRLEHMRFLHIKLQQFDFLQWLQRLQDFRLQDMTGGEVEMIESVVQRQMICNCFELYPDYVDQLQENEVYIFKEISHAAGEIDAFNNILQEVDSIFNEFITEDDPAYNMLKEFNLEKFAINDFDQSGILQAWEISAQLKLLFIVLFGKSKPLLAQIIQAESVVAAGALGDSSNDLMMVEHIYNQIEQLWSRLHDFILCHIITDMGYTEAMMQSVVGKDSRPKSKHVEFLREGQFYAEEQFVFAVNALYRIYEEIEQSTPDDVAEPEIIPKAVNLGRMLGVNTLRFPSNAEIIKGVQKLRQITPDDILDTQPVAKDLLTRRVEKIALAMRCERILVCDPLQKYIIDRSVSLLPPNARPVRIITCPNLCDSDLGGFQVEIASVPKLESHTPVQTLGQAKHPEKEFNPIEVQERPPYIPAPSPFQTPGNIVWGEEGQEGSAFREMNESMTSPSAGTPNFITAEPGITAVPGVPSVSTVPVVPTVPAIPVQEQLSSKAVFLHQTPIRTFELSTPLPGKIELYIQNIKLGFYKDQESEVREQIFEFLSKLAEKDLEVIKQDLDGFLFYMSTCEAFKMDVWARMYSWMCNYPAQEYGTLVQNQKLFIGKLLDFAQQYITIEQASQLFEYVIELHSSRTDDLGQIEELLHGYMKATLEIAYCLASEMREEIINLPAEDFSKRRNDIALQLYLLTFCGEEVLAEFLISEESKRKFALCSFLCTCPGIE